MRVESTKRGKVRVKVRVVSENVCPSRPDFVTCSPSKAGVRGYDEGRGGEEREGRGEGKRRG